MQRIGVLLLGLAALPESATLAQQAAGAALWRLAGTTLPVPPALLTGPTATFWNPAQIEDSARTQIGVQAIQTPATIGAMAVLTVVRTRVRSLGQVGIVFGHVGLTDLARTGASPDPVGGTVPVYATAVGATWARAVGRTAVGGTLAFHETRLDATHSTRVTLDVGASREVTPGLRVAAATHFFSSFSANDPAQDVYAGVEYRLWRGPLWGDRAALRGRYGIAFGHGFTADHQVGLGLEVGRVIALDAGGVREGSYGTQAWRGVAGVSVTIGRYRVTFARDSGVNELGSAYRVGVDARFK
ncbi:MAG TPA: hypothetical protein VGQ06_13490 [Gemmatimonadales bacterium]|jgi:hypothetical protein|nr:hypothetical protein [Gemmatimonadales bacterium]